jgi:hypothetical protein
LTRACHMRKESVLDRVVLRTPGRIVDHANLHLESVRQFLQVIFEEVATRLIASSSIAQHQDRCCLGIFHTSILLPPVRDALTREATGVVTRPEVDVTDVFLQVVDAVGVCDPFCQGRKVMVERVNRFLRVKLSVAKQVADQLLFLGIDADDRVVRVLVLGSKTGDLAELRIPLRMAFGLQFLLRLASAEVEAEQQFRHGLDADTEAVGDQVGADAPQREIGPEYPGSHGVASGVVVQKSGEGIVQSGEDLGQRVAATPFFRERSGDKGAGSTRSRLPRRMVFSSQSRTRAR